MTNIMSAQLLPILFISHGGETSPMFSEMDKHSSSAQFLRSLSQYCPVCPRAILVISAHWEESDFSVGYQKGATSLIYDYYGFPPETYAPHLTYDCPTDLQVADRVASLLIDAGIPCKKQNRGFDHGVFIPLKLAYPEGNVPVVQLSLKANLDPTAHVAMGEALAPLRAEGVLIVASGALTHNLGEVGRPQAGPGPVKWAAEFTEWLHTTLEGARGDGEAVAASREALINAQAVAPHFRRAHPRTEHFAPMYVAFGASYPRAQSQPSAQCTRVFHQIVVGSLALDSYLFN